MKTLKFMPNLVELILDGSKTETWRPFDDKDLKEGDEVEFINKETGERFGTAIITSVVIRTLGTLTDEDWEGHERYSSDEEMYKTYQSYFPDEDVGPDTELKIVGFEFTPIPLV